MNSVNTDSAPVSAPVPGTGNAEVTLELHLVALIPRGEAPAGFRAIGKTVGDRAGAALQGPGGSGPGIGKPGSRRVAGVDFGVKGTQVPSPPLANHAPSRWDDMACS